jgi:hypothetical protein
VEGPYRLNTFRAWLAAGALSTGAAGALRLWRAGEEEPEAGGRLLTDLLAAEAAAAAGHGE